MSVSLTESPQHFWEELIGHDALSGQLIKPLGEVGRRRRCQLHTRLYRDLRFTNHLTGEVWRAFGPASGMV
jgi:hypothetical protein